MVTDVVTHLSGTRWPSVEKRKPLAWVLAQFSSSKSRKRYLSVSARKKEGVWSSSERSETDFTEAYPTGVRQTALRLCTISLPNWRYL